jgi:hypothetical protein
MSTLSVKDEMKKMIRFNYFLRIKIHVVINLFTTLTINLIQKLYRFHLCYMLYYCMCFNLDLSFYIFAIIFE